MTLKCVQNTITPLFHKSIFYALNTGILFYKSFALRVEVRLLLILIFRFSSQSETSAGQIFCSYKPI